jgi:aminoglycoside N3'-acetyltransferase
VLHLGTSLTSCTAIHLGEFYTGRRPFIRWALVGDRGVQRVRVAGCSAGFDALDPHIAGARETRVGDAEVRVMSLHLVVQATVDLLSKDRFALVCPERCRRCLDAAGGGPLE